MSRPIIIEAPILNGTATSYRVYRNGRADGGNGRIYIGSSRSREEAEAMIVRYLDTGERSTKQLRGRIGGRKCWIVPRITGMGRHFFELYGHDDTSVGRQYICSARTRPEAEAAKAEFLRTGLKPAPRYGGRATALVTPKERVAKPRRPEETQLEAVRRKQREGDEHIADSMKQHNRCGPQPLTDERRDAMRRMLERVEGRL